MTVLSAWSEARTLADLGSLTADWLEGRLPGEHPNGYDRPDEETLPLIPSLAAANTAGFVTTNSQPGCVETIDGRLWEQWAWVTGLADAEALLQLCSEARKHGVLALAFRATDRFSMPPLPVTTVDGEVYDPDGYAYCAVGQCLDPEGVAFEWEGCHPAAVAAAVDAWQVTLVDPEMGRGDRLWTVLDAVSGRLAGAVTA